MTDEYVSEKSVVGELWQNEDAYMCLLLRPHRHDTSAAEF